MGAFALRRPRGRRLLPRAGFIGVGLLAFAIMFPTAGEARLRAHQLEIRKECSTQQPERSWIRGAGSCKGQLSAPTLLPQRVLVSGKLGAALAADLYCRTSSIDLSEFTRKATAACRFPRRLSGRSISAATWPGYRDDRGFRGRAASGRMIRAGAPERLFAGCRL